MTSTKHTASRADDHDGRNDKGWLKVVFGSNGDVAVVLDHKGVGLRFPNGGGGESPHAYHALKILAEAIRIDSGGERQLRKDMSQDLKIVHDLLESFPWPSTLSCETYWVQGDNFVTGDVEGELSVTFTPMNDSWIGVGLKKARFRSFFGSQGKLHVYNALTILGEAIRLDTVGN